MALFLSWDNLLSNRLHQRTWLLLVSNTDSRPKEFSVIIHYNLLSLCRKMSNDFATLVGLKRIIDRPSGLDRSRELPSCEQYSFDTCFTILRKWHLIYDSVLQQQPGVTYTTYATHAGSPHCYRYIKRRRSVYYVLFIPLYKTVHYESAWILSDKSI